MDIARLTTRFEQSLAAPVTDWRDALWHLAIALGGLVASVVVMAVLVAALVALVAVAGVVLWVAGAVVMGLALWVAIMVAGFVAVAAFVFWD
jgi:hypothetical protein